MKITTSLILFVILLSSGIAQAVPQLTVQSGLELLIGKAEKQGVHVGALWNGKIPYAKDVNESLLPASVLKVITARNALEKLGPDFKFKARLKWKRVKSDDPTTITDLQLIGDGDPSWGFEELGEDEWTRVRALATLLHEKGVTTIVGDVRLEEDNSFWKDLSYPDGWQANDSMSCYGAMPGAFNIMRNCAGFIVTGENKGRWMGFGIDTEVRFNISTGSKTDLWVERVGKFDPKTVATAPYIIKGTIAQSSVKEGVILPIMNVKSWVRNLFIKSLENKGMKIVSQNITGDSESSYEAILESPPLYKILQPMLKSSSNLIAQALFYKMQIPDQNTGLMEIKDGAGLSRLNRVTATGLYDELFKISKETYFTWIWDALPIAGVDGTLKNRMQSTVAEGKIRAKTGTLSAVSNLMGYIPEFGKNGEITALHPFVFLTSMNGGGLVTLSRSYQDKMAVTLYKEANDLPSNKLVFEFFKNLFSSRHALNQRALNQPLVHLPR